MKSDVRRTELYCFWQSAKSSLPRTNRAPYPPSFTYTPTNRSQLSLTIATAHPPSRPAAALSGFEPAPPPPGAATVAALASAGRAAAAVAVAVRGGCTARRADTGRLCGCRRGRLPPLSDSMECVLCARVLVCSCASVLCAVCCVCRVLCARCAVCAAC